MKSKTKILMLVSGLTGFSLFLLIHFTTLFDSNVLFAAAFQLGANSFVFLSWFRGFRESQNLLQKLTTGIGFTFPLCMASVTIYRVLVIPLLT